MSEHNKNTTDEGEDRLLDHQYDGIQEFDNPMPRWWVWIYWGSFWFSLAYVFHYWVGNGISIEDDYKEEARVAVEVKAKEAARQTVSEESLQAMLADPGVVKAGSEVYATKCVSCHMDKGQGIVGPNLTDDSWIHGKGTLVDIHQVVSKGVPEKGMLAWEQQLTPIELRSVVAFVGTLRGTNIKGKPPEGVPLKK